MICNETSIVNGQTQRTKLKVLFKRMIIYNTRERDTRQVISELQAQSNIKCVLPR